MFDDLRRNFRRAVKRMRHEALTLDDITTIAPVDAPGTTYTLRARRQYNSEYWKIYGPGNLMLPREWCRSTCDAGLTLKEALDKLEEYESKYADQLRGRKGLPYNHYSKVRGLLPPEKPAAQPLPPDVTTAQPVKAAKPFNVRKPDFNL